MRESLTIQRGVATQDFSRADVMIAIHGAGMTNTMFMSPGSAVVQVMPPFTCGWHAHTSYRNLAQLVCPVDCSVRQRRGGNRLSGNPSQHVLWSPLPPRQVGVHHLRYCARLSSTTYFDNVDSVDSVEAQYERQNELMTIPVAIKSDPIQMTIYSVDSIHLSGRELVHILGDAAHQICLPVDSEERSLTQDTQDGVDSLEEQRRAQVSDH